jgi:3-oxoacyl-[acyl-carrier-protein] synthase-1
MRAGIAKFDELPYCDNRREPIIGATVAGLDPKLKPGKRLIELLAMAITDCIGEKPNRPTINIPLLVGLGESGRPGGGASLADSIIRDVQAKLTLRFHAKLSRGIPKGHVAGCEALRIAREVLKQPEVSGCLVCGVDSYINASSLLWLERNWRLKSETNSDGVIPGEAAACVLLQAQTPPKAERTVQITGLGFGHEKAHVLSEEPLLGHGLAEATRAALAEAGIQMHDVDFRLSDVTGESRGFKEQALVTGRVMRVRRECLPIWHCADSIGDTGAAAGICQVAFAYHAFLNRYAPGSRAVCYSSAVPGDRAVAIIQRQKSSSIHGHQAGA